jgi:hypothetical protein
MSAIREAREERPLGELFSSLAEDSRNLIRQELELAKTEMTEKVEGIGKDLGSMVVGVSVLYAGFLVLLAALVLGLGNFISDGGAALLVGLVVGGIGAALVMTGLNDIKKRNFKPEKTAQTVKETKQWAKEQMK